MRNLDNLFNDSRHYHNFLDNLLNLHNFWNFNQLLNDLLNFYFNFFDPFDSLWYLNNLFDGSFHHLNILNVMNNWLLHLYQLCLSDDFIRKLLNLNDPRNLDSLNCNLVHNFRHSNNPLLNYRYFHSSINHFLYFFHQRNNHIVHSFNLANLHLWHNFLNNLFNFYDLWNFFYNLDDFLNNLRNF